MTKPDVPDVTRYDWVGGITDETIGPVEDGDYVFYAAYDALAAKAATLRTTVAEQQKRIEELEREKRELLKLHFNPDYKAP